MIKKYNVTVHGTAYQVEVEEARDSCAAIPPAAQAAPPSAAPATASAAAGAAVPAGAETVTAPMPGTILSVKVKAGDAVKRGDVLFILEAMKMENEILAGTDGTVAAVHVTDGASVNTGDLLLSLN